MAGPTTVDDYLETLAEDRRDGIEMLRRTVRAAAPDATETIAYLMPAFRTDGQFLVSFAAFKQHYSLFPASDAVIAALGPALTPFLSGKGTIRFPADRPIPLDIVRQIVEVRLAENAAQRTRATPRVRR